MLLVSGYREKAKRVNERNSVAVRKLHPVQSRFRQLRKDDIHELHAEKALRNWCHVGCRH